MTRRIKVALIATALTLGLAAAAGAMVHHQNAGGTLVFAGASDPVTIDGPLVSDGESLRVVDQIFEGLVGLKPGTTQVVPLLATSWKSSPNGLNWRFALRRNVKFQDGTPFNAACRLRELHALVPLPRPAPEQCRHLLLEHRVRRLREACGR